MTDAEGTREAELMAMLKKDLLAEAEVIGAEVSESMTKKEITAAVIAHEAASEEEATEEEATEEEATEEDEAGDDDAEADAADADAEDDASDDDYDGDSDDSDDDVPEPVEVEDAPSASVSDEEYVPAAGEVHASAAPIMLAGGIALTLAGILIWPIWLLGVPLLAFSVYSWVREDVLLWEVRPEPTEKHADSHWAMVWLICTEALLFAGFFAFWFWAKWHVLEWDSYTGARVFEAAEDHNVLMITVMSIALFASAATAHFGLKKLEEGDTAMSRNMLYATAALGAVFLLLQAVEYGTSNMWPGDSVYATAFYGLTGLHGLHVLVGALSLGVCAFMVSKGFYTQTRHGSLRALVLYWHFVDLVWIFLLLVVYVEVV